VAKGVGQRTHHVCRRLTVLKNLFITFEGGEGSGKSTQARKLTEHLSTKGFKILSTREPGGTNEAEALRSLLVNGTADAWSPEAEALLMNAARDSHLRNIIRPALAQGETVICDRFMDSTRVYQGFAGGCDLSFIKALEYAVVKDTVPNLTLIFDLDPVIGLARAGKRSNTHEARFEGKGLAFHQKLRDGFQFIAKAEPMRCHVIKADQTEREVFAQIEQVVERALG
jgi:dTMP kinase